MDKKNENELSPELMAFGKKVMAMEKPGVVDKLIELGQLSDTEFELRHDLEIDPDNVDKEFNLAHLLLKMDVLRDEIEALEK